MIIYHQMFVGGFSSGQKGGHPLTYLRCRPTREVWGGMVVKCEALRLNHMASLHLETSLNMFSTCVPMIGAGEWGVDEARGEKV